MTAFDELCAFLREKGFDFTPTYPFTNENPYQNINTPMKKGWFAGNEFTTKTGKPVIHATFCDWRTNERFTFRSAGDFSASEKNKLEKYALEQQKIFEENQKRQHEETAKLAQQEWESIVDSGTLPPYLAQKKLTSWTGCKSAKTNYETVDLVVPMFDIGGKLWGLQRINETGRKEFLAGQKTKGLMLTLGHIQPESVLYIAEGIATALTVHAASKKTTVCCFNATNILPVAKLLRERYPNMPIVICGDDDKWNVAGNVGREKATEATKKTSSTVLFPTFKPGLESKPTDFNDLLCLESLAVVADQLLAHNPLAPQLIIKTENTGFHSSRLVGKTEVLVPEYEDLRRFFERQQLYKILCPGDVCYVYNGKYYEKYPAARIKNFAQTHFNPTATNKMVDEFKGIVSRTNLKEVKWFDSETHRKINFQNGYLDLDTMQFHPHTPNIGFRTILEYNYEPQAQCPNFDRMMNRVTKNDVGLQKTIWEFLGYCLSQDKCWAQAALVLEGSGENGKSTLLDIIRSLVGQTNIANLKLEEVPKQYNLATLDGKSVLISEETPSSALTNSSLFKELVQGGHFTVRLPYQDPYEISNRAKIIFTCNELPDTPDTSHAFFRRLLLIPLRAVISKTDSDFDPHIAEKLKQELPGIFNAAIGHYKDLKERKRFFISETSTNALEQYRRELEPLINWLEHNVEYLPLAESEEDRNAQAYIEFHELYESYVADCRRKNFKIIDAKRFSNKLKQRWPDYPDRKKFKRIGTDQPKTVLRGVKLVPGSGTDTEY